MKKNIIITISIMVLLMSLLCVNKSYGICFDLEISGENSLKERESIQLEAIYIIGNDFGENQGRINEINVTEEARWSSSDENIAIVENGSVYGVQKGRVTITAEYTYDGIPRESSVEIEVCDNNDGYDPNDETCSPIYREETSPEIYPLDEDIVDEAYNEANKTEVFSTEYVDFTSFINALFSKLRINLFNTVNIF